MYPKIINYSLVKSLENILALVRNDTVKISVSYKFCILVIFGFFVSTFFNPLTGILAQDSVFYLNAIAASLCIIFLLSDVWLPNHDGKVLQYLWYLILFFCLPFLSTYTMVRSLYYWSWIANLALATILLSLITTRIMFFLTLIPGVIFGIITGSILNRFFPPTPMPPSIEFDTYFALYSCSFLLLIIALIIHNRVYVQKQLYNIIEQQVAERTIDLQNALAVKREFLDNVSHEIKTPIHNIINIVTMLYDQWGILLDDQKRDLVLDLKTSNNRLLSLCSNLLDFSKFKKGIKALTAAPINIVELLNDCLHEYANTKDLISLKISNRLHKIINCDADEILQVLRNIISNAIEYGKNTPIDIQLTDHGKDSIKITVSDRGVGVPEEEFSSIFNPFEQSSITKTRAGGTGLGLAICKKIIERHNGRIWATNNQYGGATFHIIIPRGKQ